LANLTGSLKSQFGSYGLRAGKLIANKAARTSTTSTTGVQLFTAGTVTLVTAALHIFAVSGSTPSVTVTVQSSATQGGSYTTRATFTAATAVGSQYVSAAISTTDQWWRATFTISGTSPSFTAAVSAAVS
jgi:predicted metalloprotease